MPKIKILKSIIGRYLSKRNPAMYFHVADIYGIDTAKQTVKAKVEVSVRNRTATVKNYECGYAMDDIGVYSITSHRLLGE